MSGWEKLQKNTYPLLHPSLLTSGQYFSSNKKLEPCTPLLELSMGSYINIQTSRSNILMSIHISRANHVQNLQSESECMKMVITSFCMRQPVVCYRLVSHVLSLQCIIIWAALGSFLSINYWIRRRDHWADIQHCPLGHLWTHASEVPPSLCIISCCNAHSTCAGTLHR